MFPYALALVALRYLSAFETTLAVNLEPVYAIALAIVLLNEQRDPRALVLSRGRVDHGHRVLTPMGLAPLGAPCGTLGRVSVAVGPGLQPRRP
jgi:hypothetical protein